MRIIKYLCALILSCLTFHSVLAQDVADLNGNYPVTESWSVTIAEDNGETPAFSKTYQGTSTGTLVITNGNYTLINKTGLPGSSLANIDNGRTIYYDSGDYSIGGSYPIVGFAGNKAIVQLSFFVVAVTLPVTDYYIPVINPNDSDSYSADGSSLDSLSGSGDETDDDGFTASASSTAGLTMEVVAPTITTPPISQVVVAGSEVSFSVGASGAASFTYKWKHGGTTLSDSGEFGGTTTPTLTINNVQTVDAGSYTVVVSDSKGSTSASATLTVAATQPLTNLYSFTGGNDGARSAAQLLLSGNTLYGTTSDGGSSGSGTVFSVNTDGTGFTLLHSFTNSNDGARSEAGLILSGNTLYGTASEGGALGNGTVFAVNTDGTGFTTLYPFTGGSDGARSEAGLILSGNTLYGTASEGGASGNGTVFAVNTDGTGFTTLYPFTDGNDGANPQAGLILSGNTLYGTAGSGGSSGNGTVFSINTDGTGFKTLYSFSALDIATDTINSDGANPQAGLILSGNTLYGTAGFGGSSGNGTVFSINTDGTGFKTLYSFSALDIATDTINSDGANPQAGLILSGNTLYGTAGFGGSSGNGTVFFFNTDGTGFTTLYAFTGGSDGAVPQAGLILSSNTLYGTTSGGGTSTNCPGGCGTVFKLAVGGSGSGTTALIAVQANPANGGTVSGGGTFAVGSSQQISASANSGWTFTGWSDGGTQTHDITAPLGGATYTANFTASCTYTLSAANINLTAKGGSETVRVKASSSECSWIAASNDPFITITESTATMVKFSVPGNTNTTALVGTLMIAGESVTVTQAPGGCTFRLSPKTGKLLAKGGAKTVRVTPNFSDCAWTAVSNDPSITITGGASGIGKGTVSYTVAPNTNTTALTGSITIGSQTFTITQAGAK